MEEEIYEDEIEEDIEEVEEEIDVKKKKKKGLPREAMGKKVSIVEEYAKPEILEFIIDERSKESPKPWADISTKLIKEGHEGLSPAMCKKLFYREAVRSVTMTKTGGKQFTDYTERLNKMYKQYVDILGRWINSADFITKKFEESEEVEPLQAAISIMKLSKEMKTVMEEVREAMNFNRDQQEKITIEQKNQIYSEDDIRKRLFQYLKEMEASGKLVWKNK